MTAMTTTTLSTLKTTLTQITDTVRTMRAALETSEAHLQATIAKIDAAAPDQDPEMLRMFGEALAEQVPHVERTSESLVQFELSASEVLHGADSLKAK